MNLDYPELPEIEQYGAVINMEYNIPPPTAKLIAERVMRLFVNNRRERERTPVEVSIDPKYSLLGLFEKIKRTIRGSPLAMNPAVSDAGHALLAHQILGVVLADEHIYMRTEIYEVEMRGRLGYSCIVRVSAGNARNVHEASQIAAMMFPDLQLVSASGFHTPWEDSNDR